MRSPLGARSVSYGVVIVLALYVLWAAGFIRMSSVRLFDGTRTYCLFDDAMISMRYAENLARGRGLVWNPGERVEGYTNPLMVAVMALFLLALPKPMAVLGIQILGVALMIVVGLMCVRIYERISPPEQRAPPWLILAAALCLYTLSFWSLLGMETGLVVLLTLLAADAVVSDGDPLRRLNRIGWLSALMYLARPDAFLIGLTLGLPAALAGGSRPARVLRLVLPGLAVLSVHVAFRLAYYGELVPNTAVLRLAGMPLSVRLQDGLTFLLPFFKGIVPLAGLAVYSLAHTPTREKLTLAAPMVVLVVYQWSVGGEPWAYWRIMAPALPLAVILACDGAVLISARALPAPSRPRVMAIAIAGLSWALVIHNRPFVKEALLLTPCLEAGLNRPRVLVAYALRELTTPRATLAVVGAGAVPFYAERKAIDMLGKCDPEIAHLPPDLSGSGTWYGMITMPGHNKYDLRRSVVDRRPTFVQFVRWGRDDISEWVQAHYVQVTYKGAKLWLLRGSPDVRWELLTNASKP